MRTTLTLLPIVLLLAGCGGGAGTGAGPDAKISLKYSVTAMPQAAEQAAKECAAHGRTAKQRDPAPDDNGKSVVFDCV
jgi:hypothetical protein